MFPPRARRADGRVAVACAPVQHALVAGGRATLTACPRKSRLAAVARTMLKHGHDFKWDLSWHRRRVGAAWSAACSGAVGTTERWPRPCSGWAQRRRYIAAADQQLEAIREFGIDATCQEAEREVAARQRLEKELRQLDNFAKNLPPARVSREEQERALASTDRCLDRLHVGAVRRQLLPNAGCAR